MTTPRTRLSRTPLRVKLVAAVLALAAAGLLAAGLVTTTVLRTYLVGRVDADLAGAVPQALRLVALAQSGRVRGLDGSGLLTRYYVSATGPSGTLVVPVPAPPPALPDAPPVGRPFTTGATSGDGRWRALVETGGDGSTLVVAAPLAPTDATVSRMVVVQAVVGGVVLALLGAAGYAVVRTSLRPLREVETTAAAIAGGELSLRVPRQDDTTEVGRLAAAFNSMLGRIETAFQAQQASESQARASEARLRQFVADASHELRTPLTSIRGFAELYRQGAVPPGPDLDRVMGRVEGEAARMGQLVEEMLLLARLDQQRPLESAPVDLLRLAADAVHDAQAVDPGRTVRLDVDERGEQPVVLGDEARLRQVLANLLANALTHTPPGTAVCVRLGTDAGRALLDVTDAGPGLTPDQVSRVFERFYRADSSRGRSSGGSGLGLSIVQAVVEAHGGRVGVRSAQGHGATFSVELPLAG